MLAFRIFATIFMGISIITAVLKDTVVFESVDTVPSFFAKMIIYGYSALWRSFVIVAIWLI